MEYKKRVTDRILADRLQAKAAVLIEGAKWCGKTTTALQQAKSVLYMQDPKNRNQNISLASLNPAMLLKGDAPRLIDEWQIAPKLWDAIRYEADARDSFGQFILTGSATPADMSEVMHTGTGRITHLLMRPMSLYESGDSTGEVSLAELFEANTSIEGKSDLDLYGLAFLTARGGWPKSIGQVEKIALFQAEDYYDAVVNTDICDFDGVRRNKRRVESLMRSYTRSIATQTKTTVIMQDMAENMSSEENIVTISSYIDSLRKIFVIEESEAWNPNLRSKTAVRTAPTRYFTDPSIGCAAMGTGPDDLINDLNTFGLLFENLCIRDLRIYAQALGGKVYHYRDKNGLECDAVIHLKNGKYGLAEIKLGSDEAIKEGAANLKKLESKIDTDKMAPPSFKMIITAKGGYAYKNEDGIFIVPIATLKW